MIIPEKMNERIRFLRMQHGYTQQEIINILGVGKSVYSMYESGERTISVEIVTKLAKLYNVSTDFIIGLSNNTRCGKSTVDSYLTDEAVRTIDKMGSTRDKNALVALNTLLSDRQCCKLFERLYKVLYMPQSPNIHIREDIFRESPEFEANTRLFLMDLFGLSDLPLEYSNYAIEKIASEIGVSVKYMTKEARNVAKMLFMTQVENFIERNLAQAVEKNRVMRVITRRK